MAYYHKNLKYHECKTEKHHITQEEVEFLCNLQKEMNTQDTCCQADPRFWVIKGTEERLTEEGYGDVQILYDNDAAETVARTIEQAYEYIKEKGIEEIKEIELLDTDEYIKIKYDELWTGEREEALTDMEEVADFLNIFDDRYIDRYSDRYSVICVENAEKIYPDTMFLTQKEAEEHLKANDYHYSDDAHTYAMTAWRSPEVGRLWKILREVDWEDIKI